MGQLLLAFLEYMPFAKPMAGLREDLHDGQSYHCIMISGDRQGMTARHCCKPRLKQPNK
jgi:hypothetical protein